MNQRIPPDTDGGSSEDPIGVELRELLPALGFVEVWGAMTERQPAFEFKAAGLEICAAEVMSFALQREFFFGGFASAPRSLRSIQFSIPLHVESVEQGVAWIVHGIGTTFAPAPDLEWFSKGKQWQHLLPWVAPK